MLQTFTMRYQFNNLVLSLYVDCSKQEVAVTVTYNRRIVSQTTSAYHDKRTPDMCDAWARKLQGEHGNIIETLEWQGRSGLFGVPT